ncbi:unnamed protein product, partial [Protopolystoma xenopodis]
MDARSQDPPDPYFDPFEAACRKINVTDARHSTSSSLSPIGQPRSMESSQISITLGNNISPSSTHAQTLPPACHTYLNRSSCHTPFRDTFAGDNHESLIGLHGSGRLSVNLLEPEVQTSGIRSESPQTPTGRDAVNKENEERTVIMQERIRQRVDLGTSQLNGRFHQKTTANFSRPAVDWLYWKIHADAEAISFDSGEPVLSFYPSYDGHHQSE